MKPREIFQNAACAGLLLTSCGSPANESTYPVEASTEITAPIIDITSVIEQPTSLPADIRTDSIGERSLYLYSSDSDTTPRDSSEFEATIEQLSSYDAAARQKITRVILSFGGVTFDGMPTLEGTFIDKDSVEQTHAVFPNAKIGIAIGGDNDALDAGWAAALKKPEVFAAKLAATADVLDISALALDYEFPSKEQKGDFTKLVSASVAQLGHVGIHDVSVAIPPTDYNREGIDLSAIAATGVRFEDMTYDLHGTWETEIHHDSPNSEAVSLVEQLIAHGIPKEQILGGYPFYGRRYTNTASPLTPVGQPINDADKNVPGGNTLTHTELAKKVEKDSNWRLANPNKEGSFMVNPSTGEVVTFHTPEDYMARNEALNKLGVGRMGWSAAGMTEADLQAFVS